jgi:hypothetical protein
VTLFGAGQSLSADLFTNGQINSGGGGNQWRSFGVTLNDAAWGGSSGQLAAVLGGLTGIRIVTDARQGPLVAGGGGEWVGIDNVQVTPVPEPHEWAMMLAGLGVVAWAARRARRGEARGRGAAGGQAPVAA